MKIDVEKTVLTVRLKEQLRAKLQAKSWPEKVKAMERMNAMNKIVKKATFYTKEK